ncbi:hypothetical protein HDU76_009795, partial [Blyttiomyces sp. JEL0837]
VIGLTPGLYGKNEHPSALDQGNVDALMILMMLRWQISVGSSTSTRWWAMPLMPPK